MKNLIKFGIAMLMGLGAMFTASAQDQAMPQIPQLPVDSAVRVGTLPNGLTYYIRHNETPKGQADFYIAQKVGSILEDDHQRGLAHFLEHMCFNGTENFPGKGIINYLESIGVKFGANLNAYTSIDETVYNISAVPVARQSVQDTCLLILHDWANALTLDPKEIDAERGVIHEEWRRSMQGQMRILENLLPKIYAGNKYGYRLPIGTMEVVDNFPPQAIIDYYHTWYRPDQQGIIVVGDIDPDYIEGKIKEIFSPIKMPENAKPREYVPVEDTPGTIYAIGSDPEMKATVALMMFKFDDPVPANMRNTMAFYSMNFIENTIQSMLNQRLSDYSNRPDAEFAQANVEIGDFIVAKTKQALTLQVVAKNNDIRPAIQAAYRELLRAVRGGFTQGEYERTTAELKSRYQAMYDSRNNTPNESYSREYASSFTNGDPIPGIEMEKQIMDQLSMMVPVEAINQFLPEIVTDNNRIVATLLPSSGIIPTEAELAEIMGAVDAETIEPYKDEVKTEPLIPNLPAPGKIIGERHNKQWDATEFTLSNGVTVVVKPTTFKDNEIKFGAGARGGYSVLPASYANSIIFLPMAMSNMGLGDYTNSDLKKYLQGKQANVDIDLNEYARSVKGSSTVQDLPTLMELIHANFTEFNFTDDDFAAVQNMIKGVIANQESNPQFIFSQLLKKTLYAAASEQMVTSAVIDGANKDQSIEIVRGALADPTSFTFYFVGNIDMDTFKPLLEKYIATLPVKKNNYAYTPDPAFEPVLGHKVTTEATAMQTPQTWTCYAITGKIPYTPQNKVMSSMIAQILSKRLLDKVREEMGATYSIGCYGYLSRTGENDLMLQIPFPMKPEMRDEVFAAIDKILNDATTDITEAELNPIKEYMVKNATEALDENSDWLDAMVATNLNGVHTFLSAAETINSISTKDLMNYWKGILKQNNIQQIILNPAE